MRLSLLNEMHIQTLIQVLYYKEITKSGWETLRCGKMKNPLIACMLVTPLITYYENFQAEYNFLVPNNYLLLHNFKKI